MKKSMFFTSNVTILTLKNLITPKKQDEENCFKCSSSFA